MNIALCSILLAFALAATPRATMAHVHDPDEPAVARVERDRRLYLGMWTVHLRDMASGVDANHLIGVSVGRVYAATFINSFDRRAFTAGVQRDVAQRRAGPIALAVGYRAGLITGYDERFIKLAGSTPVLPLVQPLVRADGRRLGMELSYSGVIASAALNVRF